MGPLLDSMTQGSFERSFMAHYKDLRGIYAKRMECHGNGMALMQPVAGEDCQPVCCGYFDRNGNWNLITRLTTEDDLDRDDFFEPLEYMPMQSAPVDISWQPKASLGVTAHTVDASGQTPNGLPGGAGADLHIRYSSNSKFGAVLMTTSPVQLRAFNDEALIASWLSRNKGKLYQRYGPELKKYGLWVVTRTYTTQRASINAWMDKKKDSVISLKAKAAMLGELGEDLDWRDKAMTKDWTTYQAKNEHGVVVFLDGVEVGPMDWWLEGIRYQMQSSSSKRERHWSEYVPDPIAHQRSAPIHHLGQPKGVLKKSTQPRPSLVQSESWSRRGSRLLGAGPRRQSEPSARPKPMPLDPLADPGSHNYVHDSARAPTDHIDHGQQQSPPSSPSPGGHTGSPAPEQSPNAPTEAALKVPKRPSPGTQVSGQQTIPPSSYPTSQPTDTSVPAPRKVSQSSASRNQDMGYAPPEPFLPRPREPSGSLSLPPIRRIRETSIEMRPQSLVADEVVLHDAGMSSVSRSQSLRRVSVSSSIRTPSMTPSLRREGRSIHDHEEKVDVMETRVHNDDQAFDFFSRDMDHEMQGMLPPHMGLPAELGGRI